METKLMTEANGINVSHKDEGTGKYPLIFIHGFPFNKEMWNPQINFLKKAQRVISYDIRGFGESGITKEPLSISLFADDLIKFMDALGIEKAVVCGLSMGGYILLDAYERYPARFKALILSDTQCIADTTEAKEKRLKTIKEIEEGKVKEFAHGFVQSAFCKESLQNKAKLVEKIENDILATDPKTITATLSALANRAERCTTLGNIQVPTLIICGKEDKVTPVERAEFLFSNINNSTLKIISDAGHLSNLEQPEEFNKCVANFIATLSKE